MISTRANSLLSNPSAIMTGYQMWSENPFSEQNPNGILNFGIAENHLMEDEILSILGETHTLHSKYIHYAPLFGIEELRQSYSKFSKKYLKIDIDLESVVVQTGVTSLCESLSYVLFDTDDEILIPAPYYTGFKYDFEGRFKCKLVPIPLDNFKHNINMFKKFITSKTKGLIITHPHNPTGEVLDNNYLKYCIEFSQENNLHLICDEVYALSRHNLDKDFNSILNIETSYPNIHHLYGMAKDFTLAGLKCGFFTSKNLDVINAMKQVSYFHPVSTLTQLAVSKILSSNQLDSFFRTSVQKIRGNLDYINKECPELVFNKPDSGIFFIADFTQYLVENSFTAEKQLHEKLLNQYGINITPGKALGLERPGYFRICYAKKESELKEFCKRINNILIS
jgi:aspartate/methionine/tyrosine aminotransferase